MACLRPQPIPCAHLLKYSFYGEGPLNPPDMDHHMCRHDEVKTPRDHDKLDHNLDEFKRVLRNFEGVMHIALLLKDRLATRGAAASPESDVSCRFSPTWRVQLRKLLRKAMEWEDEYLEIERELDILYFDIEPFGMVKEGWTAEEVMDMFERGLLY